MKKSLSISIALLLICFLPILILGEQSYIMIHDNLDSEFIYLDLLKKSDNLLSLNSSGEVKQVFDGLGTSYFHSPFSFIRVLFYYFPSFWAYVINSFIVRLIGIIGMYLLLTRTFKKLEIPEIVIITLSLSFALLPIYSLYGISVTGQALLLWSFLNLKSSSKIWIGYLFIVLFPFYAHIAMTAPFILIALFLYGCYVLWSKEKISYHYFIGIGVLFLSYILANAISFINILDGEINHRSEWTLSIPDTISTLKTFFTTLVIGHYHSALVFGLPVLLLGFYLIFKKVKQRRSIILILLSIVGICLFNSLYRFISVPLEEHFHLLTAFKFNRFTFLLPFLFYLLLIVCYSIKDKKSYLLIGLTLVFCATNISLNKEFSFNAAKLILPEKISNKISTFSSFYSSEIFNEVKNHISKPQKEYRVVCLGFHPAVAQYNGFYTLDAYQNNYPLSYKNKFREVIASELDKNSELKNYYDNWGNRCYLFSAELWESCYIKCKENNQENIVNNLNINTTELKKMGCNYVISAVKVLNAAAINLQLDNEFEIPDSKNKIYLYKL